jgi:hypothetical protein
LHFDKGFGLIGLWGLCRCSALDSHLLRGISGVCTWNNLDEEPVRERKSPAASPVACLDALAFARLRLGFEPDELQAAVLSSTTKRGILNCCRQWGKSTMGAMLAVHRAVTRPGSLVVVASPSDRQSAEFVRKAAEMVRQLGMPVRGDGHNNISILFPNRSRIVGVPGVDGTVRGFSAVSLMIIDEASRMSESMYKSLRPMLAVGDGDLWMMSTPYGKENFFYRTWEHGSGRGPEDMWFRVRAAATECARIRPEFLEEERASLGAAWFRQEYLCEFIDGSTSMVDREMVERALRDDVKPLKLSGRPKVWR